MPARPRHALVLLPLLPLVPAPAAQAAWPNDPAVNVPVCTASGYQQSASIAPDGTGGVVVAWVDPRGASTDIYAQRLSAAGTPLWTPDGVLVTNANGTQYQPVVVPDGSGGAVIVWVDGNGPDDDIYAQRLDANGVPQWTMNGVPVCTQPTNEGPVVAVTDGAGGAMVAWVDRRSGVDPDLYYQRILASGSPQFTPDGNPFCVAPGVQTLLTAAPDGLGGILLAWEDYRSGNADIYAQHIRNLGTILWTGNGDGVCTDAGNQLLPQITSDGNGGAILAWEDLRAAPSDIYAQRHGIAAGSMLWTPNGVQVTTLPSDQARPQLVTDGAGGAILAWRDWRAVVPDIYAQRLDGLGNAMWGANGVAICVEPEFQEDPRIVEDGVGGAVIAWRDRRPVLQYDLYAQRVNASGAVQWTANGQAVSKGQPDVIFPPVLASDGAGGAIAAWTHFPQALDYDIYAQRVDRWGYLGAQPNITSVRDVPNDQGGAVKVSWTASPLDLFPSYSIDTYRVFRSVPPNLVAAALARGASLVREAELDQEPRGRAFLATGSGAAITFWEYVGSQTAYHLPGYSMVAPTAGDSVGGSNPSTKFLVQAWSPGPPEVRWWSSEEDSGYSVDNLAPATPAPFTGAVQAGDTHLHWGQNAEPDLAEYRLYRGTGAGFVPGPGNLVAAQADTGFVDGGAVGYYYKLSALDSHGNESAFALLTPAGTVDVPRAGAPHELRLGRATPNPAAAGTVIPFALLRPATASLVLVDAQGRLVRELLRGPLPAGEHVARWDGRDARGKVAGSGLYFYLLEVGGEARRGRLVVAR